MFQTVFAARHSGAHPARRRLPMRLLGALLATQSVLAGAVTPSADAARADPPAPPHPAQTLSRPADHVLVWSDEFDGKGLPDPTKWAYDTGMNRQGWHNHELQYYAAGRPENSVQKAGRLVLTARRERLSQMPDWGGQAYSSVRLITRGKAEWTYGFFEIRAKLACGRGTWPAIWMLGAQGEWPATGELDIMEHIGHEPGRVFSTVHTTSGSGGHGKGGATRVERACDDFHLYQMLWTPEQVRFGIDGVEHARYDHLHQGPDQWPFDKPQFLILNIAVGGDLGGRVSDDDLPASMEIDHVRVYQTPRKP